MYFLAIVCPPLAILLTGKPFQALLNIILCILGWIPGAIHAILIVKDHKEEKRLTRLAKLQMQIQLQNQKHE